jgi:hypothetical protein
VAQVLPKDPIPKDFPLTSNEVCVKFCSFFEVILANRDVDRELEE